MALLTQAQLEEKMVGDGLNRAYGAFELAEARGSADTNPYAASVYRAYVEPLSKIIEESTGKPLKGRPQGHIAPLRGMDSMAVAFLAVRTILVMALEANKRRAPTVRRMMFMIGSMVYNELYLSKFQETSKDLYFVLEESLTRKRSRDVKKRMAVYKSQARDNGIQIGEWEVGVQDQVGAFLLQALEDLGFIDIQKAPKGPGRRMPLEVSLTEEVMLMLDRIKGFCALNAPWFYPCVEKPRDWEEWDRGGFHTEVMRKRLPYCIKARSTSRSLLNSHRSPLFLKALSTLQATPWKINTEVLEVLERVMGKVNKGELVSGEVPGKPERLAWMEEGDGKPKTAGERKELTLWKRSMSAWYTASRLQRTRRLRLGSAIRTAKEFKDYDSLYFVYFADSRGRRYPCTTGISPQGSDLQRALLHYRDGVSLSDPDALGHWLATGATLWGYDKASIAERAQWYRDRVDTIRRIGHEPCDCLDWMEAEKPIQFLAWCLEFVRWEGLPDTFTTHCKVSFDGTCSGLQHFSAILRDERGGLATNLTSSSERHDVYQEVADATVSRVRDSPEVDGGYKELWLTHGVTRKVTKRSTMATPYGIFKRTAVQNLIDDYVRDVQFFEEAGNYGASHYLMGHVWEAKRDIVEGAVRGMDWLMECAKKIIRLDNKSDSPDEGVISWVTPSGFLATQAYYKGMEHNVRTKLLGHIRIKVVADDETASALKHASGLAPNFIHSMDAAHMDLVINALEEACPGAPMSMVHDDFGTNAACAATLFRIVREEFYYMYRDNDVFQQFRERYPYVPEPPPVGKLNLKEVLTSVHSFS